MTTTSDLADISEFAELRQLADDIFTASVEPVLDVQQRQLPFNRELWTTLSESGLTLLSTPEAAGGSGAGLRELAVVLERSGYHAAPVPLAENDLLASWLMRSAGLPVVDGPMTAAVTSTPLTSDRLITTVPSVPWAQDADLLVIAGPGYVAALPPDLFTATDFDDLAGQPYPNVNIDTGISTGTVGRLDADISAEFRLRGALARALQTCGALTRALELSGEHVTHRIQFGRPLAKFQAVQAMVADGASALCLAKSASDFAVDIADAHGFESAETTFAVAVAKIESCRAATVVARNAHQAHGAIGFTLDHRLRHFTMRALAWRSEFGSAREWQNQIGRMVIDSPMSAWEFVTAMSAGT